MSGCHEETQGCNFSSVLMLLLLAGIAGKEAMQKNREKMKVCNSLTKCDENDEIY